MGQDSYQVVQLPEGLAQDGYQVVQLPEGVDPDYSISILQPSGSMEPPMTVNQVLDQYLGDLVVSGDIENIEFDDSIAED